MRGISWLLVGRTRGSGRSSILCLFCQGFELFSREVVVWVGDFDFLTYGFDGFAVGSVGDVGGDVQAVFGLYALGCGFFNAEQGSFFCLRSFAWWVRLSPFVQFRVGHLVEFAEAPVVGVASFPVSVGAVLGSVGEAWLWFVPLDELPFGVSVRVKNCWGFCRLPRGGCVRRCCLCWCLRRAWRCWCCVLRRFRWFRCCWCCLFHSQVLLCLVLPLRLVAFLPLLSLSDVRIL